MAQLFIKSFTIKDVIDNPEIFTGLLDPHQYLPPYPSWVDLLRTNPYAQEQDLALILAVDDCTVVGRLGFYAGLASIGGKRERIFWMSGFFLREAYRTTGVGGLMMLKGLSVLKGLLASGGPSAEAQKLYKAAGLQEIARLRRFVYFYQPKVIIQCYLRHPGLVGLCSRVMQPLLNCYYRMKSYRAGGEGSSLAYRPVERLSSALDQVLAKEGRNHFPRDSQTLNWVLAHRKLFGFEIYRNHELLGYCLLSQHFRREGRVQHLHLPSMTVGCLLDYYLADDSLPTKRDLLLFCLKFFQNHEVDLFECQVYDEELAQLCRTYGLREIGGNGVFFKTTRHQPIPQEVPWFLTYGTSDVILF